VTLLLVVEQFANLAEIDGLTAIRTNVIALAVPDVRGPTVQNRTAYTIKIAQSGCGSFWIISAD
jgi:hypothetical protein